MQSYKPFAILLLTIGVIGCSVNTDSSETAYNITNDELKLSERLGEMDNNIAITLQASVLQKGKEASFSLNLVAEIKPPVVGGVQTMATMVSIFDDSPRAAVSYNLKGDERKGAIDFLQIIDRGRNNNRVGGGGRNPIRVRSNIEFSNAKANAVYIGDDYLFLAHSSNDPSLTQNVGFSAVQMFEHAGFNIKDKPERAGLPGFAANSIRERDDILYVTSGNDAGLSIFDFDDENLSEKIGFIDIPDARWVDAGDDRIVVLASNPETGIGTLYVLDIDNRAILNQFTFEGADTPEAKNTVEIKGDLALVAAGRSGTHLIDLNNGSLIANIPIPDAAEIGLSPDVVESNAASADEEFIFIANGAAGVYVAEASIELDDYESGDNLTVELLGYLKFDELQSVNHVTFRNKMLIVAAGLGGVKVVNLDN